MKILILNTPFKGMYSRASRSPAVTKSSTLYYPIWLAYTTGVLEQDGHDVKLIDAPAMKMDKETVLEFVNDFKPELAVVDTTTGSIYNDIEIAEDIKALSNCFTVLVGTHVSAVPYETLKACRTIDAIARHEYDYIIRDVAKALNDKKDPFQVPGVSYKKDGKVFINPDMPFIKELDELPFVTEVYKKHLSDVIPMYFNANTQHPMITILTGRGCPHHCIYCVYPQTMTGHGYRYRSVKNVVDELEYIQNNFPEVKEVFFEDDTLTINQERSKKLAEEILRRKLKISWVTNSRADADYETLVILRKSGCRLVCVGFESANQRVLDGINKRLKVEQIYKFMKAAKKAKMMVHGCFLVGNPGESKETLQETLEMALNLPIDTAQFYPIMIYPGTKAFEWAKENKYLNTTDYNRWLTDEGLHNSVVTTPGITHKELVNFCDMARRKFYLRPAYLFSKIIQFLMNPKERSRLFRAAGTLIRFIFRGSFTKNNV